MVSKELISLLSSFTPKEVNRLEDFLKSLYLNNNQKLIELFSVLKTFYPLFSDPILSNQLIHSKVYPSKKFNDSTIRNLSSELKQVSEKFLVIESLNNNPFYSSDILLQEFRERNLLKLFKKKFQSCYEELEEEGLSSAYFDKKNKLENHKLNFNIMYDSNANKDAIHERIQSLNQSAKFLTVNCFIETQIRLLKTNIYENKFNVISAPSFLSNLFDIIKIPSIASMVEETDYKEYLTLYAKLYNIFTDPNDINLYLSYKSLYETLNPKLSILECGFHNSQLINYCNIKLNIMDESYDFKKDLFFLYKELVEFEYFKSSENDLMPANLFRNIVIRSLSNGEYEWTEQFINTNYMNVNIKDRKNIVNLALFLLYGQSGRYELALHYLNKIKLDNYVFKYDEYLLKIKVFYELNLFDEGLYAVHSFSEFVHNNDFESIKRKKKYLNFIKVSSKLFSFKLGKDDVELDYLSHQLLSEENIVYKDWLLEKLRLENKKQLFTNIHKL